MKHKALRYICLAVFFVLAILFVAQFGGPSILKLYIETGIGNCQKIPILCKTPQEAINAARINKEYIGELVLYKFPKMTIFIPKGFNVVQEVIQKVYYKKYKRLYSGAVIYLLYQPPDFFVKLFPQVKKQGINDNYTFLRRTMFARIEDVQNLTDTFFVIMKGIFIPDLGNQNTVRMSQFVMAEKRGFINYNLRERDNYFDCNIINNTGDFFKIYIKDKEAKLNLEKVLAIISTATSIE